MFNADITLTFAEFSAIGINQKGQMTEFWWLPAKSSKILKNKTVFYFKIIVKDLLAYGNYLYNNKCLVVEICHSTPRKTCDTLIK